MPSLVVKIAPDRTSLNTGTMSTTLLNLDTATTIASLGNTTTFSGNGSTRVWRTVTFDLSAYSFAGISRIAARFTYVSGPSSVWMQSCYLTGFTPDPHYGASPDAYRHGGAIDVPYEASDQLGMAGDDAMGVTSQILMPRYGRQYTNSTTPPALVVGSMSLNKGTGEVILPVDLDTYWIFSL